jgi:hypothetical protein
MCIVLRVKPDLRRRLSGATALPNKRPFFCLEESLPYPSCHIAIDASTARVRVGI